MIAIAFFVLKAKYGGQCCVKKDENEKDEKNTDKESKKTGKEEKQPNKKEKSNEEKKRTSIAALGSGRKPDKLIKAQPEEKVAIEVP